MKRVYYFDFLRAIAILSVLLVHSASPYLKDISADSWGTINFIDSIVRYSVPIFIMINGALLLSKKDLILRTFIKKRFTRLLLPTFAWSLLYLFLYKSLAFDFTTLKAIFNAPVYYHLWFMYMLISLYIAYPLLWAYTQKANKSNLLYVLLAWFLLISVEPALQKFYGINIGIRNEVFTYYMGYFLLGFFLSTYNFSFKYSTILYGLLTLILIWITAYGTEILSQTKLNLYFYGNTSPNVIIMSVTVYLFFKEIPLAKIYERFPSLDKLIMNVSHASLGVYLLHPIILNLIRHNSHFLSYSHSPVLQLWLSWSGTVIASFFIIYIIKKSPSKVVV